MKWTVGKKIGTGFGVALVILTAIGAVSYTSTNRLTETAKWVAHTHEVIAKLESVLTAMVNAETGQRGFIITGEDAYLEPFRAGTGQIDQLVRILRDLTKNNPGQQRRLDALGPILADRAARMQGGIDVRRTEGLESAQKWVLSGTGKAQMDEIRGMIAEMKNEEITLLEERSEAAIATSTATRFTILFGTVLAFAIMLTASVLITRNIAGRLREITATAKRIADGDLTGADLVALSRDEVGELAETFNVMRKGLREMSTQIRSATENVNATAAEILAATQQQAAATKEQAAAIQQITSTLEEISQSGGQMGERAKRVSATVESVSSATQRGMRATQDASQAMEAIREQVGQVAENVVGLSERTQTIGEIIATVAEISEQSNLLALNASIEAVSAGEQGSRFAVVAHEMKNLADRAKDCTGQVRTILSEIQRGINTSVMLTEEAVKRVDGGKSQSQSTEATIREVTTTNEESIQAFQQIVAGTNQQQIGVGQVTQGMQDMRQSIKQTAVSVSQLEKTASSMNALSQQLHRVVELYRV